eukprot:1047864-Pelagomonas_calceolata.AAC.3
MRITDPADAAGAGACATVWLTAAWVSWKEMIPGQGMARPQGTCCESKSGSCWGALELGKRMLLSNGGTTRTPQDSLTHPLLVLDTSCVDWDISAGDIPCAGSRYLHL